MRSLLPLRRLERLHRLPDVRRRRRTPAGYTMLTQALALDGTTQLGDGVGAIPASLGAWSQTDGIALAVIGTAPSNTNGGVIGGRPSSGSEWLRGEDVAGSGDVRARHRDTGNTSQDSPTQSSPPVDSAGYCLHIYEITDSILVHYLRGPSGEVSQSTSRAADGTLTRLVIGATYEGGGRGALSIAQAGVIAGPTTDAIRALLYTQGGLVHWDELPGASDWLLRCYRPAEGAEVTTTLVVPDRGAAGLSPVSVTFAATALSDLTSTIPTGVAP